MHTQVERGTFRIKWYRYGVFNKRSREYPYDRLCSYHVRNQSDTIVLWVTQTRYYQIFLIYSEKFKSSIKENQRWNIFSVEAKKTNKQKNTNNKKNASQFWLIRFAPLLAAGGRAWSTRASRDGARAADWQQRRQQLSRYESSCWLTAEERRADESTVSESVKMFQLSLRGQTTFREAHWARRETWQPLNFTPR